MNPPRKEEDLFRAAVPLAGAERAAFLNRECAGDPALRARLDALLAAHDQPDTLFGTEAGGRRPTISLDLARDLADELVGQTIGCYKLLEKIGEGGCGVVYVAEQTKPLRRRVALKIIKLGMDTKQVVARFEAERQALAMMDHPNIAKVLDAGTTDCTAGCQPAVPQTGSLRYGGRPYFVMELVRGIKITDYCDQEQLSTRDRLDLFIKVCQAIQHAHQKGVIHRDIKPSNILVTLHDGVPVPKVIDFGIAKAVEGRLTDATVYTQLHQFLGTPAYMSPEQAEMSGLDIDTRTDIYSLGVLLYELLTGVTPFDAKELMSQGIDAMRRTIREQEPVRPSTRLTQLRQQEQAQSPIAKSRGRAAQAKAKSEIRNQKSEIESDLDWIVLKCLEKERTRRYDNASALAQDVQRHLDHRPIQARPITTAARVRKWIKRRPAAAALVGMCVLTVLALLGTAATQLTLRDERRLRTEVERRQRVEAELRGREASLRQELEVALDRLERAGYSRNITLAQRDWEEKNVARARQLLDECKPELRRWEWDYLQARCNADLLTVAHDSGVRSLAFSPNGRAVASGTADGQVVLTSIETGEPLFSVSFGPGSINGLAFAPDGDLMVAAAQTNLVILDAATGSRVRTIAAHGSTIEAVAWSPDGKLLASGGWELSAKVWNAATGELAEELTGHRTFVRSVAFSPDSVWLATAAGRHGRDELRTQQADRSGEVSLWNLQSGRLVRQMPLELVIAPHNSPPIASFLSVAFDPAGNLIAGGRADGVLELWSSTSGLSVKPFPKGGLSQISRVAFLSPERVVSVGADTAVRVWSLNDGAETARLEGHTETINAVAVSLNGRFVASGSEDKTLRLWDASGSSQPSFIAAPGVAVRVSPDGRWLAVGGEGCKVWSLEDRQPVLEEAGKTPNPFERYEPRGLAFSADGRELAASSGTGVSIWRTGGWQLKHRLPGEREAIYAIAYSPNGAQIATGDGPFTGEVILWDAETGREVRRLRGNSNAVWSVAFSPDGRRLAAASGGYTYSELRKGTAPADSGSSKLGRIREPGTISIWDVHSGELLHALRGHRHPIWEVAFSPDGEFLASVSCDRSKGLGASAEIRVWTVASGTQIAALLLDGGAAFSLSFSPDGSRLAVGTGDKDTGRGPSVGLWDWRSEEKLLSLRKPGERTVGVTFSRDGSYLAACGPDGVWIWPAGTGSEQAKRLRRLALLRN